MEKNLRDDKRAERKFLTPVPLQGASNNTLSTEFGPKTLGS